MKAETREALKRVLREYFSPGMAIEVVKGKAHVALSLYDLNTLTRATAELNAPWADYIDPELRVGDPPLPSSETPIALPFPPAYDLLVKAIYAEACRTVTRETSSAHLKALHALQLEALRRGLLPQKPTTKPFDT